MTKEEAVKEQDKINKAVDAMIKCQNCIHYKVCEGLGRDITEWIAQNLDEDNNCAFYETEEDRFVKILLEQYDKSLGDYLHNLPSIKDFKGEKAYFEQQNLYNIVYCEDCKHLDIEDGGMYATCAKAYKGIVKPWDSCGKGLRKIKDEN